MLNSVSYAAQNHKVKMKNNGKDGIMVFEPAVLNVEVGDTVTFLPTDMGHNSASVKGLLPSGAKEWNGGAR